MAASETQLPSSENVLVSFHTGHSQGPLKTHSAPSLVHSLSDGSCEQPLLEAGRETTPEKHSEISLCTQGPAGALCRSSLLKGL